MSTLIKHKLAKATKVWFSENKLYVLLDDGREVGVPLEWFPKLREADANDLKNWRLIGDGVGIHWETLDEDLSVQGLLN